MPTPPAIELESAWRQAAAALLDRIRSGRWPVGTRIPGTRELARELGIRQTCAQKALASLAGSGVIARRPRIGSVVVSAEPRVEIVAVVDFSRGWVAPYITRLGNLACARLEATGRRAVRLTLPVEAGEGGGLAALRRALGETRAQAALLLNAPPAVGRGLPALPFPCVAPSGRLREKPFNVVQFKFLEKALDVARRCGCRRPALVSSTGFRTFAPFDPARAESDFLVDCPERGFRERFRRAGFDFHPALCRGIRNSNELPPAACNRLAYSAVARMLALPSERRPDALLVYPDEFLPGIALAVAASGLSIPGELRVVAHRNLGAEVFVPFPCEWIDNDIAAEAESLCDALLAKFTGIGRNKQLARANCCD